MGYKYIGDGNIGISLNVQAPKPLDVRTVVNSTKDLYEIDPKYAYEGMTVANLADGNIYMLIDIKNIDKKAGWRASYESLQIITCTAAEYALWLKNTNIDGDIFSPIDETIGFIHYNTYYYIDEETGQIDEQGNLVVDSQDYYITKSWLETTLKQKADVGVTNSISSDLKDLGDKVDEDIKDLKDNYSTTAEISEKYLSKTDIESNYYPKTQLYNRTESTELFVTRSELKGGIDGGTDDFVFVTQTQYNQDNATRSAEFAEYKTATNSALNACAKTNSHASFTSVTTDYVKNEGKDVVVKANNIKLNDVKLLTEDDVEKHEMVTQDQYDNIVTKDDDTYYYIYDETIKDGWVLNSTLNGFYKKSETYSKEEVDQMLKDLKTEILNSIQS